MTKYNCNYENTNPLTDTSVRFALGVGVAQTYTVPGTNKDKYRAEFSYASNSNVFVGLNVTATSPGAGTKESTSNIEYKPCRRYVKGGDIISIITPDATAYCGVALLSLPA